MERGFTTDLDSPDRSFSMSLDFDYLGRVAAIVEESADAPLPTREAGRALAELCRDVDTQFEASQDSARTALPTGLHRAINRLRHALRGYLGDEAAEWDLLPPPQVLTSCVPDADATAQFPVTVFLEDIRSPFNVGSIIRTAAAFGIEAVVSALRAPPPTTHARGAVRWAPTDLCRSAVRVSKK